MSGIVAYGAYVPFFRLDRQAIGAALGAGGGKGFRSVASFDEDTTTMGVEAARAALTGTSLRPDALYFATTSPAYADKANATTIHAALGLDDAAFAVDMVGSVRSATGAIRAAIDRSAMTLVICSDIRTGLPSGSDERDGGDAAVALVFGGGDAEHPVLAEPVAHGSATAEFLDRWRTPGELASRSWEDRFGEFAYAPLFDQAVSDALKSAGINPTEIDHVIVNGLHTRAVGRGRTATGARSDAVGDDLTNAVGNTGAAHGPLLLADLLDRAAAGALIMQVTLSDGVDVTIWRTTQALTAYRQGRATVADAIASTNTKLRYADYLTWRGLLDREPPRRPDPDRPAGPPAFRTERWKFEFVGRRCTVCRTISLPPLRVCMNCKSIDSGEPMYLADHQATIVTYTIDRLAFSPSPPLIAAIIDFDGGGRFNCELTDLDVSTVAIGGRVQMTFRRIYTAPGGIHNYFWKARPMRTAKGNES